ncbi:MAG: LysM repeat protein [Maribacter sp.]|jgi:LysM repeat protein
MYPYQTEFNSKKIYEIMILRKMFFVVLSIVCSFSVIEAQNKVYLEYNNDCMTRMEYNISNQQVRGNMLYYSAASNPNTTLVMEIRKGKGVRIASRPSFMLPCSKVAFNESLMRNGNTGITDYYVVSKDNNGYVANYVESISLLKKNNTSVNYNSFTYGFQYDNGNLDPSKNIASNTSMNDVMYRGSNDLDCVETHTFRKSSKNTCGPHTDITFSPQLGMLKSTEFENPQFATPGKEVLSSTQLVSINHIPVDQYIDMVCNGNVKPKDPSIKITPPANIPEEFSEKGNDKATTPIIQQPKPTPKPDVVQPAVGNASKYIQPNATPPSSAIASAKAEIKEKDELTAKSEVSDYPDFSDGIPESYEHGEPTAPLINYIEECNTYKKAGFHIVRPNQTLYSISKMTGIPIDNLAEWNGISNQANISACSELRLAPVTPDMYDALVKKKTEAATKVVSGKAGDKKKYVVSGKAGSKKTIKETEDDLSTKGADKIVNKKPSEILAGEDIHIVKDGETLYTIAKVYGYTADKFMEFNGLSSDIISPNMKLKTSDCACSVPTDYTPKGAGIPKEYDKVSTKIVKNSKAVTHKMSKGDTLYKISKKYDVSVDAIMLLNDISEPKDLDVGQIILIK